MKNTQRKKHLVVGLGGIGTAVCKFLSVDSGAEVDGFDSQQERAVPKKKFDFLHICFPCTDRENFIFSVKNYANLVLKEDGIVVIHSTVPLSTTRSIGENAVHVPIRGKHPNLYESIKSFKLYLGGPQADIVARVFRQGRVHCSVTDKPENTEALKLWDTEQYREFILLNKRIHQFCEDHNLDFDLVYTDANESYNEGYALFDMEHVTRPVLEYMEGPIGGHCVEENHKLLYENTPTRD